MSLRDFYDSIDLESVHDFLDARREENLTLDFKTVNRPVMTKEDRGVYSKALSGFANSSGGVIVWGVEACKQNDDEYDVVCDLPEVEDAPLLVQRLNEHTGACVSPIVEGVLHQAILTGSENRGFVKTFIPESDSGPHMALIGQNKHRYFKRSGDSCYPMEHYDVADMFGRRPKPSLSFVSDIKRDGGVLIVNMIVENSGRGTAKSPFLAFELGPDFELSPGVRDPGLPKMWAQGGVRPGWYHFGSQEGIVIHPGMRLAVHSCRISIRQLESSTYPETYINYLIAAEDIALIEGQASFTNKEFLPYIGT